ncbi:YbhB/YbcL family Raf kinase inhibitor-like protein [Kosakonia quasisacchari]|uniref:YbhB/YbcL family Raf kinase inhibitor-like protein n=1 Tax=Kosakonia quasisacchari TaxID=2529380 RepID=A0A4R0HGQ8_9ENTR|nr:YbhB/YbcL family Raf kinase inhibitor-like protein [Kosakonia quasisacchari]TCC09298.1 YbhB/YbcL family Raf kinase inhibitor-like protein [Kosakonia quasisacchari]
MNTKQKLLCSAILFYASQTSASELFTLQSPAFADNALMEKKFAGNASNNPNCTGENFSPSLVWNNPPTQTQSFTLVVHDPEGATGLGVTHLVAYNISPSSTGFAQNDLRDGKGYTGGKNTPGNLRWHGPCPPPGSGAHHYTFTLIATSLKPTLPEGLTREELFAKLKGHTLAATGLIGRFGQ